MVLRPTATELLEIAEKYKLFSEQLLGLDKEIQDFTEEKIKRPFICSSNQEITERIKFFSTDIAKYADSLKDISKLCINSISVAEEFGNAEQKFSAFANKGE
ncbi:MAG: hypothetical protein J1E81_00515 [Eubacterium sp.]|nr:hypothetical protein [Eubacterium sp.]